MEREKYWLIVIIIFFALTSGGQSQHQLLVYNAYIGSDMTIWKEAVDNMEQGKNSDPDYLLELINYQYGYTAWCLGNDKNKEARKYLLLLERNLEKLKKTEEKIAEYHAYKAAFYGFKIGLSPLRAPFFGPKSMDHAKLALEKDSLSLQGNMEMGNIWSHMPKLFGGSKQKALYYYLKALRIIEEKPREIRNKNWIYLNLIAIIGKTKEELGNTQEAIEYYKKAIQIEPDFKWVKNELLPSLTTN